MPASNDVSAAFNEERAAKYDAQANSFPWRESFNAFMLQILSDLPADARILCVGVGTGLELVPLAQAHPGWRFLALDPSEAMLAICRQRAEREGFAERCEFHHGYLESLPAGGDYDAALCFLVSHFILDRDERVAFFREIASRLRPDGRYLHLDLASDTASAQHEERLRIWFPLMAGGGVSEEQIQSMREAYTSKVAILPPQELQGLLEAGGFTTPTLFFQAIMLHAWFARRSVDLVPV